MKVLVCFGGGDLPSDTERFCLRETGNERRDNIGQLEEKLRGLQVRLVRAVIEAKKTQD